LLAVDKDVDVEEMRIVVTERLLKLFQRKPGILGRRLSKSDIEKACRVGGVDYIEVKSPTEEIIPSDRTKYVVLDGTPDVQIVYSERKQGTTGAY
jgi:phage-related baseplate assembly protein